MGKSGPEQMDTLAEWLRRRPAKPMGSARVGSNPTGVVFHFLSYFQATTNATTTTVFLSTNHYYSS